MLSHNPFADLLPAAIMQTYVVLMFLLVVGSTLLDVIHKKSAKYFFQAGQKAKKSQTRSVGSGEKASIAVKTAVNEVMLSAEFCNARRRIAHLLGMYGFVIFLVTTVILIFLVPHLSNCGSRCRNRSLAYRCADGLCRRVLVLVFH